jgi:UDP-N-acetylglucosamine diphosphorylase/glucosamine-1-phosphate N-acetyltransferase
MNNLSFTLFDDSRIREQLLPFTYTRAIADIRIGITTIKEKWEQYLSIENVSVSTLAYLQPKYKLSKDDSIFINACILPNDAVLKQVIALQANEYLVHKDLFIAAWHSSNPSGKKKVDFVGELTHIERPWDIFKKNEDALTSDFYTLCNNRTSQALSATNTLIGPADRLFIEEGASIEASVLNTSNGVIYIGKDAEIMEGSLVRGPFAMCEHSAIKLGGKIYGATTLGPHVKVGGEVNNSVIFGYSNKGHDGFLGNSVIGEWCNLGADTNNSNLKNNYGEVKVWSYSEQKEINTGLQFCGLFMGDHSKSGINTMFNTGTVIGVSANIFGAGFPPKHIPSFSWGGLETLTEFQKEKAFEVAERMMDRRGLVFTPLDKNILITVFEQTILYRTN